MKKIIFFAALFFMSVQVQAESGFLVKTEILNSDEVIGTPVLTVQADVEASVSEQDSYKLSVLAVPSGDNQVFVKTKLEVADEQHSPSMLVELGKKTKISVGDTTLVVLVTKA